MIICKRIRNLAEKKALSTCAFSELLEEKNGGGICIPYPQCTGCKVLEQLQKKINIKIVS